MKKMISSVLSLCLAASMATPAFAAAPSAAAETPVSSDGTGTSQVMLTIGEGDGADTPGSGNGAFSVTVPTVLPFVVDHDGTVHVATNAKIVNKSRGPVEVAGVAATGANGWAIAENGTDFSRVPVDSKQFTFTLNSDNFSAAAANVASNLALGAAWTSISGGNGELALPYNGSFAIQSTNVSAKVADVVFTVQWDK